MINRSSILVPSIGALLLVLLMVDATVGAPAAPSATNNKDGSREYWLERRRAFYRNTTFPLSEDNRRLMGGKFSPVRQAHLPFWFDYELFKWVYKKPAAATPEEELKRHNVYLNTCLRTIKKRTLFRMLSGTSDTFITKDADRFYSERNKLSNQQARSNKTSGNHDDVNNGSNNSGINNNNNVNFNQNRSEQQQENNANNNNNNNSGDVLSVAFEFKLEHQAGGSAGGDELTTATKKDAAAESPIDRAIRLMRFELDQVESRNQIETYLRAFKETDGSAIPGRLPY